MPDAHPEKYQLMPRTEAEALESFAQRPAIPLIDRSTAVTSLGSCFADNIRIFLKKESFNYLQVEPDCDGYTANWGRVYNSGAMKQIFEYSRSLSFAPAERWWRAPDDRILDPYRPVPEYSGIDRAESDFRTHMSYSQKALQLADVLILTFGLTETWRSKLDKKYFHGRPVGFAPERHEFHVMQYDEVYADLEEVHGIAKALNEKVKLIITVSPVPLRATFRSDVGTVSASAYSKAVLLAAVHTFCLKAPDVFYFPSFEIVRDVFGAKINDHGTYDQRVIDSVMQVFQRFFVK